MTSPVSYSVDADGIGWIDCHDPESRVNLINPAFMSSLRNALAALAKEPVKALVVLSAKENIFIAGADLKWLATLPDAAAAEAAAREGQALFGQLASSKVPVVCAIDGACAGGGYELALACHWRLASDAPGTLIGLPEVTLGLIPAWGGGVRLPRLIGYVAAAKHILRGTLVPAAEAQRHGLVDEVVPAASLKARARAVALRLAASAQPTRTLPSAHPLGTVSPIPEEEFLNDSRRKATANGLAQQAQLAALDVLEEGEGKPLVQALALEARRFGEVAVSPAARNLMRVFFLKNAAKKPDLAAWFPGATEPTAKLPPLKNIGIIGSGVMGTGIAQWCAFRGLGVLLHDEDRAVLKRGVDVIRELFREAENLGKISHAAAHKAVGGIGLSANLEDFEFCDLVIETVTENAAIKTKLLGELGKSLPAESVISSNTSGLSLAKLTADLPGPERVVGLHFFNPVSRMPLVEVALTPRTSLATATRAVEFVQALGKTPLICRATPGMFVTRVLAAYLNEACRFWESGVSARTIDEAMLAWGWPMGPLRLIDEIGTDVVHSVLTELQQSYPARFAPTKICGQLVQTGLTGRKNGTSSGFYVHGHGTETTNPLLAQFAPPVMLNPAPARAEIQESLLRRMIEETRIALFEGVVKTPDEADLALLLGLGFPAFRGGLLHFAQQQGW